MLSSIGKASGAKALFPGLLNVAAKVRYPDIVGAATHKAYLWDGF